MSEIKINTQGEVKLFDSDNSNYIGLKSPATVGTNQTFILPDADGSANNALKTDGSGNLGFVDVTTLVASGIDWQSSVQTTGFTAVSGKGYFCNTSGGAFTATLPASPSAGDIVGLKDYAGNFASYNLTIGRNSSKVQGNSADALLKTNRASVVLVYVDATKGWLFVQESNVGDLEAGTYISATGGTITTSGDYKIHTFTSSGTFTVSSVGNTAGGGAGVSYVVVAGGGSGGSRNPGGNGGAGGAGGYREGKNSGDPYTASPLNAPAGLTVSAQGYPVTVGAGGTTPGSNPATAKGTQGSSSIFSTITSAGGGFGGVSDPGNANNVSAGNGGSGGGAAFGPGPKAQNFGYGNTPPVSPPQGNNGGQGRSGGTVSSGAGGGAGAVGTDADGSDAGDGGNGVASSITGSPVTRAGGGGGASETIPEGDGGSGGGGKGKYSSGPDANMNGTANLGGGGGGGYCSQGGTGGSGVVIIRYKYQN